MSDSELIRLNNLELTYTPYPFGVMAPVFAPEMFEALIDSFPPIEIFQFRAKQGNKYTLSEATEPYETFIKSSPPWRRLHAYIKSDDFIFSVLDLLRDRNIDLGLRREDQSRGRRLTRALKSVASGRIPNVPPPLYSRFEFSALPAAGGVLVPHTDAASKLVTLVFSMVRPGEWREEWGGGTDILKPKDDTTSFNHVNRQVDYAETETLGTVDYKPNQAMIFVKTYNSLHGVRNMTGPEGVIRRTLTVNIQRRS